MTQSKPQDYLILRDGTLVPDNRDFRALSDAWFADQKNPRSYNAFTEMKDENVQFCGCYWEMEDGTIKACITDRAFNMIEIAGVTLQVAAEILANALKVAEGQKV